VAKAREIDLAEQLRELIADSGLSNYALGGQAGVSESVIWRFRQGERDITLATAARIAAILGAKLVGSRRRSK
jgi:transcriptional regulator with XRE-family HTH domain